MNFELQPFNRDVSDEALLRDLVSADSVLREVGRSLTFRAYGDVGAYSSSTIADRFGSWNDALLRAGLVPKEEKNASLEALFDNIRLVWIAKGKQPVYRDMSRPPSRYTGSTYNARFGGWRKALEEFVAAFAQDERLLISNAQGIFGSNSTQGKRDPSLRLRFLVLRRDSFRCVSCGRSPATEAGVVLEVDHVLAWSKGGSTVAANLQTLCFDCNRGKSAM